MARGEREATRNVSKQGARSLLKMCAISSLLFQLNEDTEKKFRIRGKKLRIFRKMYSTKNSLLVVQMSTNIFFSENTSRVKVCFTTVR